MIDRFDHIVLTVADLARTRDFYTRAFGMRFETASTGRHALTFGRDTTGKLNLHESAGEPILPRAGRPTPGSADLCLIVDRPLVEVIEHLRREKFQIELGPVSRSGAMGILRSVYLRDPDDNLVEIAEYI